MPVPRNSLVCAPHQSTTDQMARNDGNPQLSVFLRILDDHFRTMPKCLPGWHCKAIR
jgi:hypothetical protein